MPTKTHTVTVLERSSYGNVAICINNAQLVGNHLCLGKETCESHVGYYRPRVHPRGR